MNTIKKYLGVVWIILGIGALVIFLMQIIKIMQKATAKISAETNLVQIAKLETEKANSLMQWSILFIVFTIIIIGFIIFGKYALDGAYSKKAI